jgi:apolipoprotein N-acyltransferase
VAIDAAPEAARSTGRGAVSARPRPRGLGARSGVARFLLLSAGALGLAAGFAWQEAWPLAWFAFVPLLHFAATAESVRAAARIGWMFGFVAEFPAFIWLVRTIHVFGGFPAPIAIAFYLILTAYGASQFALFAAAVRWVDERHPALRTSALGVLAAPVLWTAVEFLFPNLFPWRVAHSQRGVAVLMQVGDLTGPYGLSFVMLFFAAGVASVRARPRAIVAPLVAILLVVGYGVVRDRQVAELLASVRPASIGIVQGNLTLDEKRHEERFDANVERYRRLSASISPPPDVLVWPETVVEWGIPHDALDLDRLDPLPGAKTPLVFGAISYRRIREGEPLREGNVEWFNSAFLRSSDGRLTARYDKIILMPFGEFIPFASFFPWLKDLSPNTGDFVAGTGPVVLDVSPAIRIGPLVCYEDLVASLVRRTVESGATVLLTIANLAWFGEGLALWQHESLALWRAIENRRYLVIATNTGLSSVIDPTGRVVTSLPVAKATAAAIPIHPLAVATLYARWGDFFGWFIVALAGGLLLWSLRSLDVQDCKGLQQRGRGGDARSG